MFTQTAAGSGGFTLSGHRAATFVMACLLVSVLAGCGGSSEGSGTEADSSQGSGPTTADTSQATQLMEAPKSTESLGEAMKRIAKAVSADDCDVVNELNPISRPQLDTKERCEYLRRLADLPSTGAEDFGGLGAVIDYQRGARTISTILVADADGKYRIAFIDPFQGVPSVETKRSRSFDEAVTGAIRALHDRDCENFREVAFRRFALGSGSRKEVCQRVEDNAVAILTEDQQKLKPKRIGGNGAYAFFGLATPSSYLTIVAAKQTNANLPEGLPVRFRLPADAPTYAFVDAYRTNIRGGPPDEAGDEE